MPAGAVASRCGGCGRATRSTCCSSTRRRRTSSCRARSTSRSPRPSRACAATRHRAAARSRRRSRRARTVHVPLFVNIGDRVRVDTRTRRVRLARVSGAPHRAAPRGGHRRLPARPHGPAARGHARAATPTAFTRALAHAAAERVARARRADRAPLARVGGRRGSRPLERTILRVALVEMLHPDDVPARAADPARGRDRRGGRDREDLLRSRRSRRSSTACSTRSCARCARMGRR